MFEYCNQTFAFIPRSPAELSWMTARTAPSVVPTVMPGGNLAGTVTAMCTSVIVSILQTYE